MPSVNDIRKAFLDYFGQNGHDIVESSPLVPRNDPTLMFTNAGMVQFKNVFTGLEKRPYSTAVTAQKCVRAGGKHNDLDNVGYTARHHTFFEMMGNFSFGDYFKEQAIYHAWNLVTGEFALPKDKLLVTVYHTDDEAFDLWKKIAGLPDEKIIRIPTSDNFWAMGDTGPCGPCSEIFYDHGESVFGGPPGSPDEDGDRFIEIWNLVFMQYDQRPGERVDLPKPSIDTGMGLERVAAVLQGKHNNYDIDLFQTLIKASEDATKTKAAGQELASHRVIADHLRATSFLIADGVMPSNEGRGYVLRRIMRRAMRHAHLLGAKEPLMHRLVPTLVSEMGAAYPELRLGEKMIAETLQLEETKFRKTLERGLQILEDETGDMGEGAELKGDVAFKLYDTFGFPLDLTQDALRSRGIGVDVDGFNTAMAKQKAEARKAWSGSGEAATESFWFDMAERLPATEFLGYDTEKASGEILALVKDGQEVDSLKAGESGIVIFNQTPFYAESGGQIGDTGLIEAKSGKAEVTDTQKKLARLFAHFVKVTEGSLGKGDGADLMVDHTRRSDIRAAHSATHLLHSALREFLGTHVAQKGSLVEPGRLRFDFSHPKAVSEEEAQKIEALSNDLILQNASVESRVMPLEDARETGAMALFGEKYGDEVRVVSMGVFPDGEKAGKPYSVELCGGTHVKRTGDIGLVVLTGESSVSSGVRRVEALVGTAARSYLSERDRTLKTMAGQLKVPVQEAEARLAALIEERKTLEKQLAEAKRQLAMGGGAKDQGSEVVEVNGIKYLGKVVKGISPKDLRGLVDQGKQQIGSGVVAFVGISDDGKAGIAVGVTSDLTDRLSAVTLVQAGAEALGGKGGGGRPDMAQAGGPEPEKADHAIAAVKGAMG